MNRGEKRIRIHGIIPAAGMSRRMGRPKQALPFAGSTLAGAVARTMCAAGLDTVVVVTRSELADRLELPGDPRIAVVLNNQASCEMIDSVRLALIHIQTEHRAVSSVDSADGALVVPGDMPTVPPGVYQRSIDAFRSDPTRIVIASHQGRRGHPIIFPLALASVVHQLDGGLNELPRTLAHRVITVDSDDPAILHDVDDPAAYKGL